MADEQESRPDVTKPSEVVRPDVTKASDIPPPLEPEREEAAPEEAAPQEAAPNEGATGEAEPARYPPPAGLNLGGGPPPADEPPVNVGAPVNQGATAGGPVGPDDGGQSPASVPSAEDAFADRPELYVGAAFAGGFLFAQILKRLRR